ncbi:MAG: hypothetical protein AAFM91_14410 [Pseudomonadota bacterium]
MTKHGWIGLVALAFGSAAAVAADFPGRYQLQDANATLTISEPSDGEYFATIYANNDAIKMSGRVIGGRLAGKVDDGTGEVDFYAELAGSGLTLTLYQVDASGSPVPGEKRQLRFSREGAGGVASGPRPASAASVSINGRPLSTQDRQALTAQYGVEPRPGNYWYDSNSGLYGVVGHQAFGFMRPGHNFGPMPANVSNGNTKVYINGRELPQGEWLIWSYMLGTPVMVGSYWLDASGNAGYAGNPMPIVNLYAISRQNQYNGRGGSGDNFWSTRFSAGNSDGDRGYVSVPGYGPVGYGF